ncbi:MAG: carbohydrate kinase family protein [Streptosporangiaceae bacterium]
MIAVAGEALVDLVAGTDGRTFRAYPGGSPANVAVGLARLDLPVTMLARLAPDAFGRLLRDHLRASGVVLDLALDAGEPSSLAVATLDAAGGATYDFRVRGTADWQWCDSELPDPLPDAIAALHTGSIAMALDPGAQALERFFIRERGGDAVTLSYDPNLRPGLMGDPASNRRRVERQAALAHVVKVSEEDLRWTHPREPYESVAARWLDHGACLVVVTRGAGGAYAATREAEVERPAAAVEVVDTVGAGDAFTAGLLGGLHDRGLLGAGSAKRVGTLDGAVLADLLDGASLAAGLTCTRPGADPPTRTDLSSRFHDHEHLSRS